MKAEEFLKKQGYVETVHPPGQAPFSPTFQWSNVVSLLEEYGKHVAGEKAGSDSATDRKLA